MQLKDQLNLNTDSQALNWMLYQLSFRNIGCGWCVHHNERTQECNCSADRDHMEPDSFRRTRCMPGIRAWVLDRYKDSGLHWKNVNGRYSLVGDDEE